MWFKIQWSLYLALLYSHICLTCYLSFFISFLFHNITISQGFSNQRMLRSVSLVGAQPQSELDEPAYHFHQVKFMIPDIASCDWSIYFWLYYPQHSMGGASPASEHFVLDIASLNRVEVPPWRTSVDHDSWVIWYAHIGPWTLPNKCELFRGRRNSFFIPFDCFSLHSQKLTATTCTKLQLKWKSRTATELFEFHTLTNCQNLFMSWD